MTSGRQELSLPPSASSGFSMRLQNGGHRERGGSWVRDLTSVDVSLLLTGLPARSAAPASFTSALRIDALRKVPPSAVALVRMTLDGKLAAKPALPLALAPLPLLFYAKNEGFLLPAETHAAPDRKILVALRAFRNHRSDRDGGYRSAARLLRPQNSSLPRDRITGLRATRDQLANLRPRLLPRRQHFAMGQR